MSESYFLHKEPCPACGSRDNLARYSDGHAHCFGCEYYEAADGEQQSTPTERKRVAADLLPNGEFVALTKRKLTEETCRRAGYWTGKMAGQPVQVANICNPLTGQIEAQKVRFPNKDFRFLGESDAFYLQHLWRDGGKHLVITEGEVDANTVFQVQDYRWPVVSITKGAKGAKKQIAKNMEWLLKFENVILMFDMDEPGQEAAVTCAALFPPGRCKIARLSMKDPNELLLAGKSDEIITAKFEAKTYRPDGVVTIADIRDRVLASPEQGLPWWDERLTALTYGRRLGETYGFGAGTGVGKTDWFTEQMQFDMTHLQEPVGIFALEQMPAESVKRVAGKYAGRRFHVPDGSWTQQELVAAIDRLEKSGKLFLYDNFGATDWGIIKATIRFLAQSEGVRLFYLDHLTALAAAEDDERTALERIMSEMAALAKELHICIHFISHLATPEGKPHEEGGRVMIRHFKGSRAIGFWSHFMFGLEREQQSDDPARRSVTTFRCLKDRYTGNATGEVIHYTYDKEHGRLVACDAPSDDEHGFNRPEKNDDF